MKLNKKQFENYVRNLAKKVLNEQSGIYKKQFGLDKSAIKPMEKYVSALLKDLKIKNTENNVKKFLSSDLVSDFTNNFNAWTNDEKASIFVRFKNIFNFKKFFCCFFKKTIPINRHLTS